MRRGPTTLAAMAALTLGTAAGMGAVAGVLMAVSIGPAAALDFEDEPPAPDSYGYEETPEEDEGYRRRRFRREGGGRGGSVCVTARGNCIVPPAPYNAPCGCVIPGFGPKRGAIGG